MVKVLNYKGFRLFNFFCNLLRIEGIYMKILVYVVGVLGSYFVYVLICGDNDVILFVRNECFKELKKNRFVICYYI